ncbi:hypothetical protein D3C71_50780 [compost metagenome]
MRSFLLTIFFVASCFFSYAYKPVRVLSPQSFLLNSSLTLLGRYQLSIPLNLPYGTVRWYYSISTSKNPNSGEALRLFSQLLRFEDPTGTLTDVVSSLAVPKGYAYCDVFLLDGVDCPKFTKLLSIPSYYGDYSRKNFISGVVEVPRFGRSNNFCLGVRNNATSGVYVSVEVVALVQD